jgi:hypothetical protein
MLRRESVRRRATIRFPTGGIDTLGSALPSPFFAGTGGAPVAATDPDAFSGGGLTLASGVVGGDFRTGVRSAGSGALTGGVALRDRGFGAGFAAA